MKRTKKNIIESRLVEKGFIDNFWCIDSRITTRLGAVIDKLKNEGWYFDEAKSGYIEGTKNWKYVLKSAPAPKLPL